MASANVLDVEARWATRFLSVIDVVFFGKYEAAGNRRACWNLPRRMSCAISARTCVHAVVPFEKPIQGMGAVARNAHDDARQESRIGMSPVDNAVFLVLHGAVGGALEGMSSKRLRR